MENNEKRVIPLFSRTVTITGKHAVYMKALTNKFDTNLKQGFFKRNLDVYLIAPIVGKIYNRKADPDYSIEEDTKIFLEQLNGEIENLFFNYRLIVFLEDRSNTDIEERCNRAFRYDKNMEKRSYGDKVYNSYVLGGIEFLYEKLIGNDTNTDILIENSFNFMDEYNELYKEDYEISKLFELCNLSAI